MSAASASGSRGVGLRPAFRLFVEEPLGSADFYPRRSPQRLWPNKKYHYRQERCCIHNEKTSRRRGYAAEEKVPG
jgi:hypothetical protein